MSPRKAFAIVLGSVAGGTLLGTALGYLLGKLLPNYYAMVLPGGIFDPIQAGVGLGLTQGLIGGGVVGLAIVAILTWREVRLLEIESRRRN